MQDKLCRDINYIRISITARCNLRCRYCMPEQGVESLSHGEILRFEEILRLARILGRLGIRRYKVTGGEPLVRKGCPELVGQLKALPMTEQVTITTNGILLKEQVPRLKAAGLDAVNISLDTLDADKYDQITRGGDLARVLEGIEAALAAAIPKVKINCVPQHGFNEDELLDLALLAKDRPLSVRFIEMMPIGEGGGFAPVSGDQLFERLTKAFGPLEQVCANDLGNGPAVYYRPAGFSGLLGLINAVSHAFCGRCNRLRLTADGFLKLCLYYQDGLDLKTLLRSGAADREISAAIRRAVAEKPQGHHFGKQQPLAGQIEAGRMSDFGG